MALADSCGGPATWLRTGAYNKDFIPTNVAMDAKFYRFYSYRQLLDLFDKLGEILNQETNLGSYVKGRHQILCEKNISCGKAEPHLAESLGSCFNGCRIVPQGMASANKRIHMFLRWMVRQNSPVDIGLWSWYSPANLIVPLDTHVVQEAIKLGLLSPKAVATAKTAKLLTEKLRQVWPQDPCRGDFALFGNGVMATL